MEFEVLGPVRVLEGAEPVDIGGPKQRSVLALLIANHRRAVSAEVLVQAIYGEDTSARRQRNIQTYVSILRSVLGDVISRSGEGWVLDVDRSQIDALRFEDAVEQARTSSGPPVATARSLHRALALWRGHPYQDIDEHGFLQGERSRLVELRQAAQSARIDADLEAGRHAELIGELEGLLLEHPYSERIRAQHMLALYRSGRQQEALASYSALRRLLGEELGLDPTPELQLLERQILEHDSALGAARATSGNLPSPSASFIGRESEVQLVKEAIRGSRLVTISGVGGVGKTRLALEVARQLAPDYPGGVWLVELAALSDPMLVDRVAAGALGIDESGGGEPRQALIDYLSTRPALLLLDNCEHLLQPVAALVDELLRSTPETTIVATSRELLGVQGEAALSLRSMSMPPARARTAAADAEQYDAIRLFTKRSTDASHDFRLDDDNLAAVIEICRRLDGIPLAIELAALRTRTFPPSTIAELLDHRFRLLTGGARTALPRQQTLAATIEWSYRLLGPAEQIVFRRLSAFRGGWSHHATTVVADDDVDELDLIELLPSLVDKSLIVTDDSGAERRYSMLETIRQYSLQEFESTDDVDRVRARHADYFEQFAGVATKQLTAADDVIWLWRIGRDLDNLRQAMSWCMEHDRQPQALRIAAKLWYYWAVVQRPQEGTSWIRRTREAAADIPDSLKARSLFAEAALLERSAGVDPEPLFLQSIEIFESLIAAGTDLDVVAECYPEALHLIARMYGNNKYDEQRSHEWSEKQLAAAELFGDARLADVARGNLARAGVQDYAAARADPERAAAARAMSDNDLAKSETDGVSGRYWARLNRAILELELGEPAAGAGWVGRAAEVHAEAGLEFLAAFDRKRMALWGMLGRLDGADDDLLGWVRRLVSHPEAITNPKHLSEIVSDRVLVDAHQQRWDRVAVGWGIYDVLTADLEPNFPPTLRDAQASTRSRARDELGEGFAGRHERGSCMTIQQIVHFIEE